MGSSSRMTSGCKANDARQTEALLLPAGERMRGIVQPLVDLIPQRGLVQRARHGFVQRYLVADARQFEAVGDVAVDAHRQDDGPREDDAHAPPQLHDVHSRAA